MIVVIVATQQNNHSKTLRRTQHQQSSKMFDIKISDNKNLVTVEAYDQEELVIKLNDNRNECIHVNWKQMIKKSKYFALLYHTQLRLVDNNITELSQFQAQHVQAAIDLLQQESDHWHASYDKILAHLIEIGRFSSVFTISELVFFTSTCMICFIF